MMARATVDLPQPDSPTTPSVRPSKTSKLTGFPASIKGGLTDVTLTGGTFGVNLTLGQVNGTHSDAEIAKSIRSQDAPPPTWVTFVGGTAAGAKTGVTRHATVNFDKGSYVWVVNSDQSELDGKTPWGRFNVTSAKSATAPTTGTPLRKIAFISSVLRLSAFEEVNALARQGQYGR